MMAETSKYVLDDSQDSEEEESVENSVEESDDELDLPEGMVDMGNVIAKRGTIDEKEDIVWNEPEEYRWFYLDILPDKGVKGYLLMKLVDGTLEEINGGYAGYFEDDEMGEIYFENKGVGSTYCVQIVSQK